MIRLDGRVALVTGAAGGLGGALARGIADAGAAVAVHGHDETSAGAAARELEAAGATVMPVHGDVREPGTADRIVREVVDEFGRVDILVNNAGVMSTARFLDLREDEWDRVLDTNLKGYFLVGQRAAREMVSAGYGRIVNVSSTRQTQAWPGNTAYCASKGGIAMLTRMMALELAPYGVRVNSIAPGTILTNLNRDYLSDPQFEAERVARIPAGRLGKPEDLVAAVVLLSSAEADFIVGASLMIDGGQTLW